MGIEQQINELAQAIVPTLGYTLYNFTFLIVVISQLYGINMKKAKMNVELIYILSFMVQLVSIMFLFIQPKLEADMTLTYLFVGMLGGSLRDSKMNNPIKYHLLQLEDAKSRMLRHLIIDPYLFSKSKLTEVAIHFYPEEPVKKEF